MCLNLRILFILEKEIKKTAIFHAVTKCQWNWFACCSVDYKSDQFSKTFYANHDIFTTINLCLCLYDARQYYDNFFQNHLIIIEWIYSHKYRLHKYISHQKCEKKNKYINRIISIRMSWLFKYLIRMWTIPYLEYKETKLLIESKNNNNNNNYLLINQWVGHPFVYFYFL